MFSTIDRRDPWAEVARCSMKYLLTGKVGVAGPATIRGTESAVWGDNPVLATSLLVIFTALSVSLAPGMGPIGGADIESAPSSTTSASTGDGSDVASGTEPSIDEMNAAGNHSLGSSVRASDMVGPSPTKRNSINALAASFPPGIPGMDVSAWQSNVNWAQAWADGGRFAYVKATEGLSYVSGQFAQQYNGSAAVGMVRGAYHFANPTKSSGAAQANYFVDNGGSWSADGKTLPPLLDIEYNPYVASDHTDTCYGLSQAQMVAWIGDFSNTVISRTGRAPAIYSTTNWWIQCTGNSPAFSKNPLFIARYPANIASGAGSLPAGWASYNFWQYSNAGVFPGDQDVFNGDLPALYDLARGTAVPMRAPVVGAGDLNRDGRPDLIARRTDGTLWFYPGTAGGRSYSGVEISARWAPYDAVIAPGDLNGDGNPDLLGRKPDGTLWFFAGTGSVTGLDSGFAQAVQIDFGWQVFQEIIAAGDVNGDGKPDLLGRTPGGELRFYAGTGSVGQGNTGFHIGVPIGSGWNIFSQVVGIGDLNRNGTDDLLAMRPDGSAWFYDGTNSLDYVGANRIESPGLGSSDILVAPGDTDGDGFPDLMTKTPAGVLAVLTGASVTQPGYGSGLPIGHGWQVFRNVTTVGDMNQDGTPDMVGVPADGSLWFYPGGGRGPAGFSPYSTGVAVGKSGWSVFSKLIGGSDVDGDGLPDLLAVRNDGSLWIYKGVNSPNRFSGGSEIGLNGWTAFSTLTSGDFNGDGRSDLLGTRADGTLWMYPGNGSAIPFTQSYKVGTGWNIYDSIVASRATPGDSTFDILARLKDGTLMLYPGLGTMGSTSEGYSSPTLVGSGWSMFTSFGAAIDGSTGHAGDLIGVNRGDGDLLAYSITQKVAPVLSRAVSIGAGWNTFG